MALHNELNAMHERVFTDELLDSLLSVYHQHMKEENCTAAEDDYAKAQAVMEHSLTDEQKNTLNAIEASWQEILRQAVPFGFSRGLYAGFQAAFDPDASKDPFQTFVVDELLTMPNIEHYPEYCNEHRKAEMLYTYLDGQVNDIVQDHLTSIVYAWDERHYGILWHAFSMGRQQALSIIDTVQYKKRGEIIRLGDYPRRAAPLPDKSIRAAAKIACGTDAIIKSYYESNKPEHKFSPEFEQKIQSPINSIGENFHQ